ncbi:hypothetical protein QAD02_010731 [Eretmocerus hayati]|uniref:Uncharacterized protein n=1 Tax=Eretmocerus hayati TaxID=131215 RepID=A0ACC2NUS9_9HYME|nr:hypothetical protein QAD02_010731 [Eretmocerus hayati]
MPKGQKLVESGHVIRVEEFVNNGCNIMIKCKVIRPTSVSKPSYSVTLRLDPNRKVTSTTCECVYRESRKCEHVAALIYFINNEESASKTSYEQTWGIPCISRLVHEKNSKGAQLNEMFNYAYDLLQQHSHINVPGLLEGLGLSSLSIIFSHIMKCATGAEVRAQSSIITPVALKEVSNDPEPIHYECDQCSDRFQNFASQHLFYKTEHLMSDQVELFYEVFVALPASESKSCSSI